MRLIWKREPKETGLSSIGSQPRGSKLHDGEKTYAVIYPNGGGWRSEQKGWYWVAGWDSDIPYINTSNAPCETEEEAKKAARKYVMDHLNNDDN